MTRRPAARSWRPAPGPEPARLQHPARAVETLKKRFTEQVEKAETRGGKVRRQVTDRGRPEARSTRASARVEPVYKQRVEPVYKKRVEPTVKKVRERV